MAAESTLATFIATSEPHPLGARHPVHCPVRVSTQRCEGEFIPAALSCTRGLLVLFHAR
jgi:hypothetical protein